MQESYLLSEKYPPSQLHDLSLIILAGSEGTQVKHSLSFSQVKQGYLQPTH